MTKFTQLIVLWCVLSVACRAPTDISTSAARLASRALEASNALIFNALEPNTIDLRPFGANPLGTLPTGSMAMLHDSGATGTLAREFLKYAVSCALDSSSGYELTWVDLSSLTHVEWYPGELGLAPTWRQNTMSVQEQQWVSACLFARVNWYAHMVEISLRGNHSALTVDPAEGVAFAVEEGTFWGNLFADTPVAYACHVPGSMAYARARLRDCAAGHVAQDTTVVSCGIITIRGACQATCSAPAEAPWAKQCSDGAGKTYDTTITTFLQ